MGSTAPTPRRIFHPKVWVLRFRGLDDSALHRVLVLSRNLTFDRCWDTMLRIDEDTDAQSLVDVSPLADFVVAAWPEYANAAALAAAANAATTAAMSFLVMRIDVPRVPKTFMRGCYRFVKS